MLPSVKSEAPQVKNPIPTPQIWMYGRSLLLCFFCDLHSPVLIGSVVTAGWPRTTDLSFQAHGPARTAQRAWLVSFHRARPYNSENALFPACKCDLIHTSVTDLIA